MMRECTNIKLKAVLSCISLFLQHTPLLPVHTEQVGKYNDLHAAWFRVFMPIYTLTTPQEVCTF